VFTVSPTNRTITLFTQGWTTIGFSDLSRAGSITINGVRGDTYATRGPGFSEHINLPTTGGPGLSSSNVYTIQFNDPNPNAEPLRFAINANRIQRID
jgi:hypothetical protein